MSLKSNRGFYIFFGRKSLLGTLVTVLLVFRGVEQRRVNSLTDIEIEEQLERLDKPAIKTIMSEDGDIIDCVDIYKQPAFDHPILRNHTLEMRPSFIPNIVEANNSFRFSLHQISRKNGSCPDGTIPIQRVRAPDIIRTLDIENITLNGEFSECKVEVARVELHKGGPYIGAQGTINVWNVNVEANEWSLNSVTVFNNQDSFLETGWAVSPILFRDDKPRLFINWLDTSKDKGCFNLRCAGFVQVSNRIMLGGTLPNVSQYDGEQFSFTFIIYKDARQGKWWMLFQGEPVGYWPLSLIDKFEKAPRVNWGGSACNMQPRGFHTVTQMGSGHFPTEGYKRASHIRNILVMDPQKNFVHPIYIEYSASYRDCYDVMGCSSFSDDDGQCIFYGGPGGRCCDERCN